MSAIAYLTLASLIARVDRQRGVKILVLIVGVSMTLLGFTHSITLGIISGVVYLCQHLFEAYWLYPRVMRRWRRGQPVAEAEVVFEAAESDPSVLDRAFIEGYTHEDGVRNVVRVKRYEVKNPPADAPSQAYVLDMVVESASE